MMALCEMRVTAAIIDYMRPSPGYLAITETMNV